MSEKTYFKTSDDNVFYTVNSAKNHARTLKNTRIIEVSISETFEVTEKETKVMQVKTAEKVKKVTPKPLNKMNKTELIAFAKGIGIECPKGWVKTQIVEAVSSKLEEQTSNEKQINNENK